MKNDRKKSLWARAGIAIVLAAQAFAQDAGADANSASNAAHREFRVRYVTTDAMYFNGGTVLGVRAGDKVWVSRDNEKIVQLEVKYVSEHSASCLLEKAPAAGSVAVRVDDVVFWEIPMAEFSKRTRTEPDMPPRTATPVRKKPAVPAVTPKRVVSTRRTRNNRLSGQLSLQSFGQKDRGPQQFDFFESSAYVRMNFDQPAGMPVRLFTRLRATQNYRGLAGGGLQQQSSRGRIYEMALEYGTTNAPLEFAFGRMLRNELRGVGYLDGLAVGYRFNNAWKAGVFYGAQPNLYDYSLNLEERKLGAFTQARPRIGEKVELLLSATGIGQYMRQHISREYLAAEIDCNYARQFYVTQYLEIDFNRDWRRQSSAHAADLSNAYFNASYYPGRKISCGLSYDARRLIRTWETRMLADSLFDQNLRQGWRANVAVQPTALTRMSVDVGWQGQKNSADVYSASLAASATNLFHGLNIYGRLSYFGNTTSSGYYPALDLSRSFWGVIYATLGGGAYFYHMTNGTPGQTNPWERLRLDFNIARRFYLSSTFENYHGDTMRFVRGFADLGWRF